MPTYPLTALVLKKIKIGETDLVLIMLGSDGALHKGVAKGARKPGSKFGGRAEPATIFEALMARGATLDIITDARTIQTHHHLREDYEAMLATSVVLDFAAVVCQESLDDERFYQLTCATLDALDAVVSDAGGDEDPSKPHARLKLILTAYLLKAAAMQGYRYGGGEDESTDPLVSRDLRYLLGATLGELHQLELSTLCDVDELLAQTRRFLSDNIPARLRALDCVSALP